MASGNDVRYICSQCLFSNKVREAFVQSTMEIVCVEDVLDFCFPSLLRGSCCVDCFCAVDNSLTQCCRLVAHNYIRIGPEYYSGMRSYGRDWQNMQPGVLFSDQGEKLTTSTCPTSMFFLV